MWGIAVMLNNYFHDLAVALLISNLALMWLLARELPQENEGLQKIAARVFGKLSRITYAALAFVLLGGVVRTLTYREYEWMAAAGRGQVLALILKHILLASCVVIGLSFQIALIRRFRGQDPH